MIVAYDLRYADGHFTGIGTHAYALLEALLELPGHESYLVLWDTGGQRPRYDLDRIRRHPRVEWVEGCFPPIHPRGVWRVGAWLRRARPDVYLSPFYLLPFNAGCPSVLTIHDVWPLRLPDGLSAARGALYRLSLMRARGADLVLTSSEFSRREIMALMKVSASRVRAVHLGVPTAGASAPPRRPERVPAGPFALLVGDNRPRKNLGLLADTWARLGPDPPLALVSVGPVDDRYPSLPHLAEQVRACRVHCLGWLEEDELAWLYEHASLVLLPSLYEGFGFPLVEAFARGLPVIASDIPVLREIAGGAARLVEPHDSDAWAAVVRELVGNEVMRARLNEAGLARASSLSYRRTAEATLEMLREVVGRQVARIPAPLVDFPIRPEPNGSAGYPLRPAPIVRANAGVPVHARSAESARAQES